jgi:hypothetical protein
MQKRGKSHSSGRIGRGRSCSERFLKVLEEEGPKSVEAKKEAEIKATAMTTHRVSELNLPAYNDSLQSICDKVEPNV